jgi:hypothetical protein
MYVYHPCTRRATTVCAHTRAHGLFAQQRQVHRAHKWNSTRPPRTAQSIRARVSCERKLGRRPNKYTPCTALIWELPRSHISFAPVHVAARARLHTIQLQSGRRLFSTTPPYMQLQTDH